MESSNRKSSKLFAPLQIGHGKIELQHRVILAPLTRNRGVPLREDTSETINRIWYPDDLVATYYAQRATKGGLLVSEGIAPNLEACSDFIILEHYTNSIEGKWSACCSRALPSKPSLWLAESNRSCSFKRCIHICTAMACRAGDYNTIHRHAFSCAFCNTDRFAH
jgi:hypothetical protein